MHEVLNSAPGLITALAALCIGIAKLIDARTRAKRLARPVDHSNDGE
jgi:membrane-bound lytic murein transglycosylase MltF